MTDHPQNRLRKAMPLIMSAVFLLVASGVVVVKTGVFTVEAPTCGGSRTPVVLNASVEKAGLLTRLAGEYNRTDRAGHCAEVQVTGMTSGDSAAALARPWDTAVSGPRPDVWSPAASSWMEILRQRLGPDHAGLVPAEAPSTSQSPLVIAMPKPMAEALGWPGRQLGWSDLLDLSRTRAAGVPTATPSGAASPSARRTRPSRRPACRPPSAPTRRPPERPAT